VALAKVKDDFSRYLRLASEDEVVITRHGRPAGILIGFASEEDWID
jgi:prevent-host-death family protein